MRVEGLGLGILRALCAQLGGFLARRTRQRDGKPVRRNEVPAPSTKHIGEIYVPEYAPINPAPFCCGKSLSSDEVDSNHDHAEPDDVVLQPPWCDVLWDKLNNLLARAFTIRVCLSPLLLWFVLMISQSRLQFCSSSLRAVCYFCHYHREGCDRSCFAMFVLP